MFERLQKPFLTVETGEAYQPIRLTYVVLDTTRLVEQLNAIHCLEKTTQPNTWHWFWLEECAGLHFESIESFQQNPKHPVRLATLSLKDNVLYITLSSFKRACLAVSFFHANIQPEVARIQRADFINKVFGLDERLPHGFSELFNDAELEKIIAERVAGYEAAQAQCENASSAEEALAILNAYTQKEAEKRLPYAERYEFSPLPPNTDPDVAYLAFYIFLRSRELVAIRRWFGNTTYTLSNAADDAMNHVFGGMDIDIIE